MTKKINIYICITILLVTSLLSGCSKKKEIVTESTYMLGTQLNISIWTENKDEGKKLLKECFERISEIEKKMSVNIADSEINRINNNAGKEFTKVSGETNKVLNKALEYAKISNGAFDPTIGKLVKLWGIGTDHERIPQKIEIEDALNYIDYRLFKKNGNDGYKLDREGMRIDLGGIAKGYAGDEVYRMLKSNGIKHAVINLGGNIFTLGTRPDGEVWKIGIQDPFEQTGTYMGIVQFSDKAIVTSGNYERFFIKNNERYHHIIDPKTGYPSQNGIISATIITNHSIDADALSTSVYILGVKKGLELVEKLENIECIIITENHKVYLSSGMKGNLEIKDNSFQIEN